MSEEAKQGILVLLPRWFFLVFFGGGAEVKVRVSFTSKGREGKGKSKVASSGARDIYLGNGCPTGSSTTAAIHYFLKISFFRVGAKFAEIWNFAFRIKASVPTMGNPISYPHWNITLPSPARDSASAPNTLRKGRSQTASPIPASLPRHCLKGTPPSSLCQNTRALAL